VADRARKVAALVDASVHPDGSPPRLYGVPDGGVYAALLVAQQSRRGCILVVIPELATHIIDDIVDSGRTRDNHAKHRVPFHSLVDFQNGDGDLKGRWVEFPWETMKRQDGPQDAVRRLLQYIGEDPDRQGLRDTPDRVIKSYGELFSGYKTDPNALFKTFDEPCDEMVLLKGIEFFSCCEHHMLPFTGTAHVAYIPDGKVIGLSKLARLVEVFARRLQVQERLTRQITDALTAGLSPLGAACMIEARHHCVCSRGVGKQGSVMVTSSLTGAFRQPEVRAEFFSLIGK
jgi:GTP cyclohydrolase I